MIYGSYKTIKINEKKSEKYYEWYNKKKTKKNYDEKCVEISTRKVIVNDSIEHPIVASNIL